MAAMKKLRWVLATAALAALGLAGCARQPSGTLGVTHLSVWSMWNGPEEKVFERVLARYHALHPDVIVENLGGVRDDTKTVRAIVAGAPPDLFTLADPLYLGPLAANDALVPLDDWFRASGLAERNFTAASLDLCRSNGKLYAMPYLIDVMALMWNKSIFREAGLDPDQPPATFEEFTRLAVQLTKRENGQIRRLGLQPLADVYLINQLFGGRLYDPASGKLTPDDPANVRALEWYVRLVKDMGGYEEVNGFAAGFGQAQGANNPFYIGKVAMMLNGEWNPYWCSRYAPELDYGVAPLPAPVGQAGRARTTWLGGNMFSIPRGSRHVREAWNLLVWLQTDEAQMMFADGMNNVPNQVSVLGEPKLRQGADYRRKFAVFLDTAGSPNSGFFPAIPVANLYNGELGTARDLALDGRKTPAQALRDVRVRVQRELDRYRR